MPDSLVEGQRMQSIVAVESLCTREEDDNSGRMLIAAVESLAGDVSRDDDVKLQSAGQNGNKSCKDAPPGHGSAQRRNSTDQTHKFSRPVGIGGSLWPPVIELSDSDDEVCVTKVEAPKVRLSEPATKLPHAELAPSQKSTSGGVSSGQQVPTTMTASSAPVVSTATGTIIGNGTSMQARIRQIVPPDMLGGISPGLMRRPGPTVVPLDRNFPVPSMIRGSFSQTPVLRAPNSFRGRPRLVRGPPALNGAMTLSVQANCNNMNVQNGRVLHPLNGGYIQTERHVQNPTTVAVPVQTANKVRQIRPNSSPSPAQVDRVLPQSQVALTNSSTPRTSTPNRCGKYTLDKGAAANVTQTSTTPTTSQVPNVAAIQAAQGPCASVGDSNVQPSTTEPSSWTYPRATRGRLSRITAQSPRKVAGMSSRPSVNTVQRRVTKKEIKNLHLDQIHELVMRYGTVVLDGLTLEDIFAKGLNEWKIPKNIKITPRLFPPRQFKAPVALADQVVEISSDDDDNDERWTPVKIKSERAESEVSTHPRPTGFKALYTATPKDRLMAGLGLVTQPEANRLRMVRPMKKDIVAVLKDRRTIKRYITCPFISVIKADCIYKYVIAKKIMRPQAFRFAQQETNKLRKPKKRRCKSVLSIKPKKRSKPDVKTEPILKVKPTSVNSVGNDDGSDTEIDEDVNRRPASPKRSVKEEVDIHAMSNINHRAELQKIIANFDAERLWTSFSTAQAQNNAWSPIITLTRINPDHVNAAEQNRAAPRVKTSHKKSVRPMERRCSHCRFSCVNMTSLRKHFWDSHGTKLLD